LLIDMQYIPAEYNDEAYFQEVLQLKVSQADIPIWKNDGAKDEKKESLTSPIILTPNMTVQPSSRGSDKSNVSIHVRTLSSASLSSSSTAISSQLSCELLEDSYTVRRKKEVMARMDVTIPSHENLNILNCAGFLSTDTNHLNPASCAPVNPKPYMWITDRIRTKVFKPRPKTPRGKSSHQNKTSEFQSTNSLRPLEVACCKCNLCICSLCKGPFHSLDTECPSVWARHTIVQLHDDKIQILQDNCNSHDFETIQNSGDFETQDKSNEISNSSAWVDKKISDPYYTCQGTKERQQIRDAGFNINRKIRGSPKELAREEFNYAAKKRTAESVELSSLRQRQVNERDRFCAFERKMGWFMTTRHNQERVKALETYEKRLTKMKEHHKRIATQLEDVQVAAEFEMISAFKKTEQNVHNRLRHMEKYCDALGRDSSDSGTEREVTEIDLRQLGQQYNLRDSMYHVHKSKINVLRDKQAKQMERLLMQQELELQKIMNRREELTLAEQRFKKERDGLSKLFAKRKSALMQKWEMEEQSEREKLESENNLRYAP
ncbi:hypothetical protein EPUL_000888, partial [Erysiphe pulchra]